MKTALFCYSDAGAALAKRLCGLLGEDVSCVHSISKYASEYGFTAHESVCGDMEKLFYGNDALIFICACGIAVRNIAPYVKSKTTDPAVIVIDDRGRFVIPLLSGHIGGANALAEKIAELTGALAVVTTATNGAGKFSCDSWAVTHGCVLSSMKTAKDVSAQILREDIPVSSEFALPESLPSGLVRGEDGKLGIFIGIRIKEPFASTLRLVPRIVTVGIGCRRGALKEDIMKAVSSVAENSGIDIRSVKRIASIDVKKNEEGLLSFADAIGAEKVFFTAEELNSVTGDFSESEFVRNTVGTGCVCERAAVLAGGTLILKKTIENSVTVAMAAEDWRVEF